MQKKVEFVSPRGNNESLRRYIEAIVGDEFFSIEFIKSDGSKRILNGRLGVTKHLKGGANCNDIFKHLTVFDVQNQGYRNVDLASVEAVNAHGFRYRFTA